MYRNIEARSWTNVAMDKQRVCGGRHWLAHSPRQDISTSEHHNLIYTDMAVVSASENCRVQSVWHETDKQRPRGRLQRLHVWSVVCTYTCVCVCVCVCVCSNLYLYHHKYYIIWECVCSLTYPTCNAHAPYCHLWPARLFNTFAHYLETAQFSERVAEHKMCGFIFPITFIRNISHSKKNWVR